jgi:hypothetical protein
LDEVLKIFRESCGIKILKEDDEKIKDGANFEGRYQFLPTSTTRQLFSIILSNPLVSVNLVSGTSGIGKTSSLQIYSRLTSNLIKCQINKNHPTFSAEILTKLQTIPKLLVVSLDKD